MGHANTGRKDILNIGNKLYKVRFGWDRVMVDMCKEQYGSQCGQSGVSSYGVGELDKETNDLTQFQRPLGCIKDF